MVWSITVWKDVKRWLKFLIFFEGIIGSSEHLE